MDMNIFSYLKRIVYKILILLSVIISFGGCKEKKMPVDKKDGLKRIDGPQLTYILPTPQIKGNISVEEGISNRRSHRHYRNKEITSEQLSQVLWAAYGVTNKDLELRSAPTAGAIYSLEIYALIGNVKDIEPGVYKYIAEGQKIVRTIDKDVKKELQPAVLNRDMISDAPALLFYSAVFSRCNQPYASRYRERYICMDVGHSAENVYLQAEALHLGTCAIGAFNDVEVKRIMQLPAEEEPLYIMPIGYYYNKPEW
jgi:SagB-type dehydrogenase family enzyme